MKSLNDDSIKNIAIIGGGTAGWMCAAAFSKVLGARCSITLIESEQIGTVGVGEATIPQISIFNNILGLDEMDFVRSTHGTFKLGIEFVNWGELGDRYIHPFSNFGNHIDNVQFYHYWHKAFNLGLSPDLAEYSLNIKACHKNKFMQPANIPNSPLSKITYAYHFDAGLYAKYLRQISEGAGVSRKEGMVSDVELREQDGFISSVTLTSGERLDADLFVDCTGFRGILIEGALKTGYEDWSNFLPCDSAAAVPSEKVGPPIPYTRATARSAGWQWRIPLQHRTGNGHVYCSQFMQDDEAIDILLKNIEGKPIRDPRVIRFKTGKRKKIWNKNCLSVGLSSGFLEPLESTSIHLIQSVISKFLGLFPTKVFQRSLIDKFNEQIDEEFLGIRDFIVLHYCATRRSDSEFWNQMRTMELPDTLQRKLDLYRDGFRMFRERNELFDETSWLAVMHGQGIKSVAYNPLVDAMPLDQLVVRLDNIRGVIDRCVDAMPLHEDFIAKNCAADRAAGQV